MAFVKTWDETALANTTSVGQGAGGIRDTKYAIRERLAIDHNHKADETGDDDIGKHKQVSLIEKAAHPANPSAGILFYDKDGKAYLLKKTGDPVEVVDETDQTILGVKTFNSVPLIPEENPEDDGDDEDENPKAVSKAYLKAYVVATEFGERMIMADIKPSGTNGGTFTSGDWRVRDLNTVRHNSITGAALLSNRFTLPAGTYHITVKAPARRVNSHQCLLYNVSDGAIQEDTEGNDIYGSSMYSVSDSDAVENTPSQLEAVFTIAGEKSFEVRHRCTTSRSTNGFGSACNLGQEVYTQVSIVKIG